MSKPTFQEIAETAEKPGRNWSNRDIAQFHYFNPNGLHKEWKEQCGVIRKMVDDGLVPSGWILAYGSMSDHAARALDGLATMDRVPSIRLEVALNMLSQQIERMKRRIAEEIATNEA